ncbi:MBL fold metallo-hydrolase [Gemmatimonas sp.]|uniref:MBL fold metallo-hydrolase n=1 Tax=Gemmatimonas sp. TaxID=1962908 RepID=UPI00286CB237|nr:MBL fold metallo-hydrolase [Gemmatimonas sp.]
MTSRRDFLRVSGGCVAHVLLSSACASSRTRQRWTAPQQPVVVTTPFAHLDAIGPDTWAVISTPLGGDRTTFGNGGIIAGRAGVIAVEGFYRPAGATWLAERARELTGRWPTHVVLTHYHLDHAGGVQGYARDGNVAPVLRSTETTRTLALGGGPVAPSKDAALERAFADVVIVDATRTSRIDLGNRVVELVPMRGHTASDLALVDEDAGITFAGDLLWNGMFPNFVDATPSQLIASMTRLSSRSTRAFVPGHGGMADRVSVARYLDLLGDLGAHAGRERAAGRTAVEAAASYRVPASLGEWMASKAGLERAMTAWWRDPG